MIHKSASRNGSSDSRVLTLGMERKSDVCAASVKSPAVTVRDMGSWNDLREPSSECRELPLLMRLNLFVGFGGSYAA